MQLDRRSFLIGLFGTVAVAAAGPLPKALEQLSDKDFKQTFLDALPRQDEVYGKDNDYAFAKIEYINEPPYVRITVPEGFRPLREESDRIGNEVITTLKRDGLKS